MQQAMLPLEDSGNPPQPSLLGLSMRMCEFEFATDNVWHVLEVMEGSPAESAGLVPYGDWIIGWSGGVLSAENDFYDVVEAVWLSFSAVASPDLHHSSTWINPYGFMFTPTILSMLLHANLHTRDSRHA